MSLVNVNDQLTNIAQIVRRCPTVTLRRAFVASYRAFCAQTRMVTVRITGFDTEASSQLYALGTDPYLEIVGIRAMQLTDTSIGAAQTWPLGPLDPSEWNPNTPAGRPVRFTYVPHGQVALFPTPAAAYAVDITAEVQPKSEDVSKVPSEGLVQYSNEIEAGALAYLLRIPDQPWTNPNMAAMYDAQARAGIANAKAQVQRGHNPGSRRVRPRPFI